MERKERERKERETFGEDPDDAGILVELEEVRRERQTLRPTDI